MNERKLFRVLLVVGLIVCIFIPICLLTLYRLGSILSPVLSALLLAYLLYPLVSWGNRFGIPKVLVVLGIVTVLIGAAISAGLSLKPAFEGQLRFLFEETTSPQPIAAAVVRPLPDPEPDPPTVFDEPPAEELLPDENPHGPELEDDEEDLIGASPEQIASTRLQKLLDNLLADLDSRGWLNIERSELIQSFTAYIARESLAMLRSFTQVAVEWGRFLMIFLFVLIFALLDGDKLQRTIVQIMPNEFFESSVFVLHKSQQILGYYLRGLVVENLIIFAIALVMLMPLKIMNDLPLLLAIVIAAIIGLTNVIRIIGPIIGGIIGVVLALTVTTDLVVLGGIIVVTVIVQLLDSILILPLVMRDQVNIHPVICLLGVIAGGILAGVLGMILAIPVISAIKVLYRVMSIEMKRFVEPGMYEDYTRE